MINDQEVGGLCNVNEKKCGYDIFLSYDIGQTYINLKIFFYKVAFGCISINISQ